MSKKSKLAVFLLSMAIAGSVGTVSLAGCKSCNNNDTPTITGSITLNHTSATLNVGEELTLDAVATGIDGEVVFLWDSSDKAIVNVVNGKITAVGTGTAIITVSFGEYSATCTVTVVAPTLKLSVSALGLYEGKSGTVTASITGKNDAELSGATYRWKIKSGEEYITLTSDGASANIVAKKAGIATISVEAEINGLKFTKDVTVSVSDEYSVEATPESGLTPVQGGYKLSLAYLYDKEDVAREWTIAGLSVYKYDEMVEDAQITYVTDDNSVAKVNDGKIIAVGSGNCLVTGTYTDSNNKTVNVYINVEVDGMFKAADIQNGSAKFIELTGLADKYYDGQTVKFGVTPKDGHIIYSVLVNGEKVTADTDGKYTLPYADGIVVTADVDLGIGFKTTKAKLAEVKDAGGWCWAQLNDGTIIQVLDNGTKVGVQILNKNWGDAKNKYGTIDGEDLYIYLYRTVNNVGDIVWSLYLSGTSDIDMTSSLHATFVTEMNSIENPYISLDFKQFGTALTETDEIEFNKTVIEYTANYSGEHAIVTGLDSIYKNGDTAKFKVEPENGYEIVSVEVNEIPLVKGEDGYYEYKPNGNFEVVITAQEIPAERTVTVTGNGATVTSEDGAALGATAQSGSTLKFKVTADNGHTLYNVIVNGTKVDPDANGVYSVTVNSNIHIVCVTEAAGIISFSVLGKDFKDGWQGFYIYHGHEISDTKDFTYVGIHFGTGTRSMGLQIQDSDWANLGEKWGVLTNIADTDMVYFYVYRTVVEGKVNYTVYVSKTPEINMYTTSNFGRTTAIDAENSAFYSYKLNGLNGTDADITFDKTKPTYTASTTVEHATIEGLKDTYEFGETATFTVTPDTDYEIKSVMIGETILTVNDDGEYTYAPNGDFKVIVTVQKINAPRAITITANNAIVTNEDDSALGATIAVGSTLKFKAVAKTGHELYFVKVNGVKVNPVDGVYTVENVTEDLTIVCETDIGFGYELKFDGFTEGAENDGADKMRYMAFKDGTKETYFRIIVSADGTTLKKLQFTNWSDWPEISVNLTGNVYIYVHRTLNEGKVCWTVYAGNDKTIASDTTITKAYQRDYSGEEFGYTGLDMTTLNGFLIVDSDVMLDTAKATYNATSSGANATVDGLKATYKEGQTATFTVTPETGYEIVSVKVGDMILTAVEGLYSHVVNGDFTVTVTAKIKEYNISIRDAENAEVTELETKYNHGETAKFKVTAKENYTLSSVRMVVGEHETILTADNDGYYSFTVTDNTAVRIVTVSATATTYNVTSEAENAEIVGLNKVYEENATAEFTVTADEGYRLVSVKAVVGTTETTLTAAPDGKYSHVVTADFKVVVTVIKTYTVTVSGNEHATVTGLESVYDDGAEANFTVEVETGYVLESVTAGDTVLTAADGTYKFTLTSDTTLTITVKKIFTLSVTENNATVTAVDGLPLGATIVEGTTLTFKAEAKNDHELYFVKVNGVKVNPVDGVYTVENVTENLIIVCETDIVVGFSFNIDEYVNNGGGAEPSVLISDGSNVTRFRPLIDTTNSELTGLQILPGWDWSNNAEKKNFLNISGTAYIYMYRTLVNDKICWSVYVSDNAGMVNRYTTTHLDGKPFYSGLESYYTNINLSELGSAAKQLTDVNFDVVKPTYTATSSGANATVSGLESTYKWGETATFTVTPASNYEVVSVKVGNNTLTANSGTYSYGVYGDFEVIVETREIPANRNITVTANNAIVTAEDGSALSTTIANGLTLKFKASAKTGHELYFVKVNGTIVEANDGVYSVTVDSDVTIFCETDLAFGFATTQTKLKEAMGNDPWNWMYPNDGTVLGFLYNGADSGNNFGIQISNNWNGAQTSFKRLESENIYFYIRRTVNINGKIVWSLYISESKSINLESTYHMDFETDKDAVDKPYESIGSLPSVLTADNDVKPVEAEEPALVDTIAFSYEEGIKNEGDPWRNF